jgi:hypothetical protein
VVVGLDAKLGSSEMLAYYLKLMFLLNLNLLSKFSSMYILQRRLSKLHKFLCIYFANSHWSYMHIILQVLGWWSLQSSQVIYIHEYFASSCSEDSYCYMYVLQALDKKKKTVLFWTMIFKIFCSTSAAEDVELLLLLLLMSDDSHDDDV